MLGPVQIKIRNLNMFTQKTRSKAFLAYRGQGANAEAGRNGHDGILPNDLHRAYAVAQTLRDSACDIAGNSRRQNEEFLPSVATNDIIRTQTVPIQPADAAQHFIPALVAKAVINVLK